MLSGKIWSADGWIKGHLELDSLGKIQTIIADDTVTEEQVILPGFIDLHVHGGGGADIMQGQEAAQTMSKTHAKYGTTAMLATTMTAPMQQIESALEAVSLCMQYKPDKAARILGVHLEGPYISPNKLGAQPDCAQLASLADIEKLNAIAPIRILTLAPEIAENSVLIRQLSDKGIRVQLGHSNASYDQTSAAFEAGASACTHLFNAMSALHHREPGMVGAALAHAEFSEIIPDFIHVHPGAMRVAMRAIPNLFVVTDSTAATGMPDGEYYLGSQVVHKCLGGVRLSDGTIAGSVLTMDQALRNLVSMGISIEEASMRLSQYPADYLGLSDRGRLRVGAWADIVVLDTNLNLIEVYLEGEQLGLTYVR